MTDITVNGFVIVPPLSPWDEKNRQAIYGDMRPRSFGKTPERAWRSFIGYKPGVESATLVQHWHNRGYRVVEATMIIRADGKEDA